MNRMSLAIIVHHLWQRVGFPYRTSGPMKTRLSGFQVSPTWTASRHTRYSELPLGERLWLLMQEAKEKGEAIKTYEWDSCWTASFQHGYCMCEHISTLKSLIPQPLLLRGMCRWQILQNLIPENWTNSCNILFDHIVAVWSLETDKFYLSDRILQAQIVCSEWHTLVA